MPTMGNERVPRMVRIELVYSTINREKKPAVKNEELEKLSILMALYNQLLEGETSRIGLEIELGSFKTSVCDSNCSELQFYCEPFVSIPFRFNLHCMGQIGLPTARSPP